MTLRTRLFLATVCLSACLALFAVAQQEDPAKSAVRAKPAESRWEDYAGLIRNNMFLRDRAVARSWTREGRPLDPEADFVLTGIAREGDVYVAFFENMQTHATEKLRMGGEIGLGRLGPMTLEDAEYQRDGATTRVEIGKNLLNQSYSSAGPGTYVSAPIAPAESPDATLGASAPTESEMTIIERLRQKRLKEMAQ